jgi:hypothetical protein
MNKMNRGISVALLLASVCVVESSGSVNANLVITAAEGQDDPQSGADGGLNASYGKGQLNFWIKADTGLVKLDSLATNSSVPEIFDWGNQLDVLNELSLEGSPIAYIPAVDEKIVVTVNAVNPEGANARLKAENGRGFGVGGSNPHRLDWNSKNATSEAIRLDVDTTGLSGNYRFVIESLHFGNGEGDARPRIENFVGGSTVGGLVEPDTVYEMELGGAHQLIGGRFDVLYIYQATKPPEGDDGFSLQGITFDVLPYHGEWGGYYFADAEGNTNTLSLLGWVNAAQIGWVWSYNFSAWFYIGSDWVTHRGTWAYMPAASEAALGDVYRVDPDWIYVTAYNRWVYRPGAAATEAGGWAFIYDL